jgi:hypothetical protein
MAQTVSHGLSARRRGFVPGSVHMGFVMDKVALGQFLLWVVRLPRPYHSTVAFHAHISPGRWTIGPMGAAVQRQSFTPRRKKNKRRCLECSLHACGRIYILYQSWCADHSGRSVCGRLVAGVAGSNPAQGMNACLLCLYVALSCVGRGLCDGLITRREKSYRVSNCMCDNRNPERGPMFQLGTYRKIN